MSLSLIRFLTSLLILELSYATQAEIINVDDEDEEAQMLAAARAALAPRSETIINADEELAAALQADEFTYQLNSRTLADVDAYGLLQPAQTVILRAYGDDGDDRVLAEAMPRYIVMYEPSREFVRRIEVG